MRVPKMTAGVVLLLLLGRAAGAEVQDLSVDPLATAANWQLGGRRVNYVLGASSVAASAEQTHGAPASLKLTYDFADPARDYLSYYHLGGSIPGRCEEVSFWLFGDASGCRPRLSLQDARDRWFERDAGTIDWSGWREVRVSVGAGGDWQPLLRRGEARLPLLQPVNLRQIALYRASATQPSGSVYLQDLRARADVVPADLLEATLTTGRPGNLFDLGEAPTMQVRLTSKASAAVAGRLTATATDFFGQSVTTDLGEVAVPSGGKLAREACFRALRRGSHEVRLALRTGDRERVWLGRLAVLRPRSERPPDPNSYFGCCFTLAGFGEEQMPTVLRLNRDGGIRWERVGFGWGEINPGPGQWSWDGPKGTEGPVGRAVELAGQAYQAPHTESLTCREAVTIACWARATGANGMWQAIAQKWGPGNERNYGLYLSRDNGNFCFSAGYAGFPGHAWDDVDSGFSAWDGQWHHYAASYSRAAKQVVLYVDGQARKTQDWDGGELRANRDDLVVGSGYPGGLDELVIYRRALEVGEVAALARKERPPAAGLAAWWSFEEAGDALRDRSPNRLTLANAEPSGARLARLGLQHGIKTLGILGFPPDWASTAPAGAARPWVYKPDLRAWAAFVENTVRHYRDLVQHWEIWNEPNISVFWEPRPSAREFLEVARTAYEAAKRGNPDCQVLMPGLAGPGQGRWGMDFLEELLGLGGARYCDAISIHPYRQTTPEESDLVGDLRHITNLAAQNGGRRPIWFTEDCWTTDLPGGSTEQRAALMLPRCYALALGSGQVERLIWFRLADPGVDRFYGEDNYGMCYQDLTPKPAYFAHATTAALLDGTVPAGAWDLGGRAMARLFRTKASRTAVVWCPEGTVPVGIHIGRPTARIVDLMGNETQAPTRDGVLILSAGEAAVFLPGLPAQAQARGALLSVGETMLVRGGKAKLTVTLRNPFATPRRAIVAVRAEAPLTVTPRRQEVQLPAKAARTLTFETAAASQAAVGWHTAPVTLDFAGQRFSRPAAVGVRSAAADAGPAGWWKLDEGQGTQLADASPNGNQGTVDQPIWVEGKHGAALRFDGRHIAVIPDAPSLNLQDEATLAFWLKLLGDTGTWQFPVGKYLQENIRRNYGVYIHKDTLAPCFSASFERGGYLHTDVAGAPPVGEGQWRHVAATFSMFDRQVRVYLDGKPVVRHTLDEGAMLTTTDPLRFGVATRAVIDEVIVYPRALREDEIAELAR